MRLYQCTFCNVAFAITFIGGAAETAPCKSFDGRVDCTLLVEHTTVSLPFKNISFKTRTYNGAIPGPVIRARPGDHVRIVLKNRLGENLPNSGCSFSDKPHAANSTNLHIHGIYDSAAHDNTFACVDPGTDLVYEYDLRPDSGTSTLWYHSHIHGSSAVQMYGGMAGIFEIVDDAQDAVFEFAASRTFVLQLLDFDPKSKDYIAKFVSMGGQSTMPLDLHNPEKFVGRVLLASGEVGPSMVTQIRSHVRFKLVNAMSGSLNLLNIGFLGASSDVCDLNVLAYDGVYLSAPRSQRSVLLPPGGRADIAVMCRAEGTHLLGTLTAGAELFGGMFAKDSHVMVALEVQPLAIVAAGFRRSLPSALPGPPPYYPYLLEVRPTGRHTIMLSDKAGNNVVDGWPYNGSISHSIELGSIQEWRIIGGEGSGLEHAHPYHQHVSHFQIASVSLPQLEPLVGRIGDYRDTVPIYAALNYTIRFTAPFVGPMMVHCHIVKHQDAGMMTLVNITERRALSLDLSSITRERPSRGLSFAALAIPLGLLGGVASVLVALGALVQLAQVRRCRCQSDYRQFP